jgi:hypothetical protein
MQVQAAHAHRPQQDELASGIGDLGMEASDLLVETLFVESVPAVEHDEDGAVVTPSLFLRRGEIGKPHRPGVGFRRTGPRTAGQQRQSNEHRRCCGLHGRTLVVLTSLYGCCGITL